MDKSESLTELLQRFRENASVKNELWNLTETLMSDLELCKQENEELRNQLNDVLNKDNTFSDLYSDLEEQNTKISEENKALKFKLNALKLQFKSEVTEVERTCESKLRNSEEENRNIKQKLAQREREFFEELQLAQATASYEFEKIEKQLKWQLAETNKQLYESNLINSKLRHQLENMHTQSMRKSTSDSMTPKLDNVSTKRNIEISTVSFTEQSNNSKMNISNKADDHIVLNNIPKKTYEPLQIECSSIKNTQYTGTPTLFRGKSLPIKKNTTFKTNAQNASKVPPLIPCSDALPPSMQKRRKLHDPDDLSYLVDLISQ